MQKGKNALKFSNPQNTIQILKKYHLENCGNTVYSRQNLFVMSFANNYLFVALHHYINVYQLYINGEIDAKKPYKTLLLSSPLCIINQIFIHKRDKDEILLSVDMEGYITLFLIDQHFDKQIRIDNRYVNKLDNSCWSLDMYTDEQISFLAASSNTNYISIYNTTQIFSGANHNDEYYLANMLSKRIQISSINNKIPSVKFSPCGQFLAAASIDYRVSIFSVPLAKLLKRIELQEWGWTVQWIPKSAINTACNNASGAFSQISQSECRSAYRKQCVNCGFNLKTVCSHLLAKSKALFSTCFSKSSAVNYTKLDKSNPPNTPLSQCAETISIGNQKPSLSDYLVLNSMNAKLNLIDPAKGKVISQVDYSKEFASSSHAQYCRLQYLFYLKEFGLILCTG